MTATGVVIVRVQIGLRISNWVRHGVLVAYAGLCMRVCVNADYCWTAVTITVSVVIQARMLPAQM